MGIGSSAKRTHAKANAGNPENIKRTARIEKILNRHNKLVDEGRTAWTTAERDRQRLLKIILDTFDFESWLQKKAEWSLETFGEGMRTVGICNHIRSELIEIEATPYDLEEWVDVLILATDAMWRLGAKPKQVIQTLVEKQIINTEREWGPHPPEDQPSFHLKGKE